MLIEVIGVSWVRCVGIIGCDMVWVISLYSLLVFLGLFVFGFWYVIFILMYCYFLMLGFVVLESI